MSKERPGPSRAPVDPFDSTGDLPSGAPIGKAEGPEVDPFEATKDVAPVPPDEMDTLTGAAGDASALPRAAAGDTDVRDDAPWFDEPPEQRTDTVEDAPGPASPAEVEGAATVTAMVEPEARDPDAPGRLSAACPQCRFVGEKGARFCVRCGADMRAPADPAGGKRMRTPPVPGPGGGARTPSSPFMIPGADPEGPSSVGSCPDCEEVIKNAAGHCPGCGRVLGEMLVLVVITPEGAEGERLTPVVGVASVGRSDEAELAFGDDPYLSPVHAKLNVTKEAVHIEDLQSLNGTFIRLNQATSIGPGDTFVVGRQLLRLEAVGRSAHGESTSSDGTRLLGSPPPAGGFVLVQLSANGRVQDRYHLPAGGGVIGRDSGEVRFPADRYVSGKHATVAVDKDKVTLRDMESSNGTWVRIRRRTSLEAGDEIYVGSQVFRVTFPMG